MLRTALPIMIVAAAAALPAATGAVLGVDFSEPLPFSNVAQIATDSTGALYILDYYSTVTKLTADGANVVWQFAGTTDANGNSIVPVAMAVGSSGDVYTTMSQLPMPNSVIVGQLSSDGASFVWQATIGIHPPSDRDRVAIAVDDKGRVYVAGDCYASSCPSSAVMVRLSADGSTVDYRVAMGGYPTSVTVDGSGVAYVAGWGAPTATAAYTDYVAQYEADGSGGYYTALPDDGGSPYVVLDASGNAVVSDNADLMRLDATGAVASRMTVPGGGNMPLALDAADNAYVGGWTYSLYHPTNSIAACGTNSSGSLARSNLLNVIAVDGTVAQSTYRS